MGLNRKHHAELNKANSSKNRKDELRNEYSDDLVALQQIDVYNGSSEYNKNMRKYIKALKSDDAKEEKGLSRWFKKHYPDI